MYEAAKKQFGLESSANDIVNKIAGQFQLLKQAGNPLHILIGRRPLDTSSLYWGWPYNENTWSQWLDALLELHAGLHNIAPLIDTLSIMYDLRTPLDEHRLDTIKSLSPSTKPLVKATCPRPVSDEFFKAVQIAKDAAHAERKFEKELKSKVGSKRHEGDHFSIEKRLDSAYGRRIRHVAEQAWNKRITAYVEDFKRAEAQCEDQDVRKVLSRAREKVEIPLNDFVMADVFERDASMK